MHQYHNIKLTKQKIKKLNQIMYIKKKKNDALIRLSLEPQIPIIKNIGIKILSKKIKKETISIAVKDSIKKISNNKKYRQ
jgi:DUF1009 family protein